MKPSQKDSVLVLIPALNESPTIAQVVAGVKAIGHTPVVIDDGSTDETAAIARMAGATVLQSSFHLGVGGALRLGLRYAYAQKASLVAQCDADGQHLPGELTKLIDAAELLQVDLVVGARRGNSTNLSTDPLSRRIAKRLLSAYATRVAHRPLTDTTSGFRVFRGELIFELAKNMPNHFLGDTFEVMIVASRSGYSIAEVEVQMRDREVGQSRASRYHAFVMTLRVLISAILRIDYRLQRKKN